MPPLGLAWVKLETTFQACRAAEVVCERIFGFFRISSQLRMTHTSPSQAVRATVPRRASRNLFLKECMRPFLACSFVLKHITQFIHLSCELDWRGCIYNHIYAQMNSRLCVPQPAWRTGYSPGCFCECCVEKWTRRAKGTPGSLRGFLRAACVEHA